MKKEDLIRLKEELSKLSELEKKQRDLHLKSIAEDKIYGPMVGYASIDKPWLKYYDKKAIEIDMPRISAYEYVYNCNKDNLDYCAINFYGSKISYAELFNKIEETKKALNELGVKSGDYVTFCMPTIPETIYLFFALNELGAVANFVDLRMNKERILKYINSTKSKLVISFHGVTEKVYSILNESTADKLIDIDVTSSLPFVYKTLYNLKVKDSFPIKKLNDSRVLSWSEFINYGSSVKVSTQTDSSIDVSNRPAAIVYTGGTTGEPKGAVLTNMSIVAPCVQYKYADIPRGNNDKFVDIMPPFIAYGLVDGIELPLSLGMENLLIPKFNPNEFSKLLMKQHPAHFVGIPSHFEILMEDKRLNGKDLSFIKNAGCGGDLVTPALEEKVNKYLKEHNCDNMMRVGYGMTENAAMSIYDLNNSMTKVGKIGIPMQKMQIGIFDENGNELGYNEVGELMISSPAIIEGYNHNEEETKKTIVTINGEKWIKTGDYASVDEDGNVSIIGRKRAMFIRPDGHNVFPDLIRNYLDACPIIKDVCVIGVKSKYNKNGKIPTAIVVLNDDSINEEDAKKEILEFQSHLLGERDGAIEVRIRKELPVTPIGKIDVMKIQEEEGKILSEINFDALTANTKKKVLKIK